MYESSYWHLLRKPGFAWMLVTQFLGALNDNLYKFVVTLFAIDLVAANKAAGRETWDSNAYLFLASALFVLPYLLFSDYAGQLADRHSKRTVLIATKSAEIATMLLAIPVFYYQSVGGMLLVLFLLATQAAFFSPAKYGSVPELLPDRDLSRGNALIEMSTFLAIILGAVSGGIIYDHWKSDMPVIAVVAVVISILGSLASFGIGHMPKPVHAKPFSWIPFRDVWTGIGQ
jgi:acyl-[acyl-carrier-protein]-phospholipid O-acyltransferase/long-chain-fatty-acid--[acyl-carrier-protein] ligase